MSVLEATLNYDIPEPVGEKPAEQQAIGHAVRFFDSTKRDLKEYPWEVRLANPERVADKGGDVLPRKFESKTAAERAVIEDFNHSYEYVIGIRKHVLAKEPETDS